MNKVCTIPTLPTWQQALKAVITDPAELLTLLQLDQALLPAAHAAAKQFPLRVPRAFVALMEKNNINDPLLQQILPIGAENKITPNFSTDPLQEADANPIPGLLHKYQSRVLLTVTGSCPVNCRYCFRRHFPYTDNNPSMRDWQQAIDYIQADTRINEVIFSGGEPLLAPDKTLAFLHEAIADIPHVTRLRIHTRMPVMIPQRLDQNFQQWFFTSRLKKIMILHCNHPREITKNLAEALRPLQQHGVTLLNQSVLLKGVNDYADTLAALSEQLFSVGVMPYYLHVLDKVQGTAHFDLSSENIKKIYHQLQVKLPGFLLPKLVREEPGKHYKSLFS